MRYTCTPKPWSQPMDDREYGDKIECVCGRRFVVRHGDGRTTPPRPYWKPVHRLHLRRYRKHPLEADR
jgi:hypothetical protein